MTLDVVRYSVGNENDPGDPWGRSELVIQPDGKAQLEHRFSRQRTTGAWTGQVDAAAMQELFRALNEAGFPAAPNAPLPAGSSLRRLAVETPDTTQRVIIAWNMTSSLPGYREAFDILDGVIRQLSGDSVTYQTTQPTIVRDIESVHTTDG